MEHLRNFLGAGAIIEGDEDGVELGASEVGLDEFRGVDVHEGDALAGLEAQIREGVGESVDLVLEQVKGEAATFEDDGRSVGHNGAGDGEEFQGVHGVGRGYYNPLEGVARGGWRVGERRLTRFLEEGRSPNRPYRNDRGGD